VFVAKSFRSFLSFFQFILQHPPFVAAWKNLEKYWTNQEQLFVPRNLNTDGHMDKSAYDTITKQIPGYEDPEKLQEWTALYYAIIEEVDEQVGVLLDQLGDDADNTLVIFTSDHGEVRTVYLIACQVWLLLYLVSHFRLLCTARYDYDRCWGRIVRYETASDWDGTQ
jgi:arylsulfatase A-like enzyme